MAQQHVRDKNHLKLHANCSLHFPQHKMLVVRQDKVRSSTHSRHTLGQGCPCSKWPENRTLVVIAYFHNIPDNKIEEKNCEWLDGWFWALFVVLAWICPFDLLSGEVKLKVGNSDSCRICFHSILSNYCKTPPREFFHSLTSVDCCSRQRIGVPSQICGFTKSLCKCC